MKKQDASPISKDSYESILAQLRRYEIILAQTENVLFDWDMQTNAITFSDAWKDVFGRTPPCGDPVRLIRSGAHIHPDDAPALLERIARLQNGSDYERAEARVLHNSGHYLWCRFRGTAIRDAEGKLTKILGIVLNINQEMEDQRLLRDRSERDSLTRLLNNATCRMRAEHYLSQADDNARCALLLIDLDNFKQINDQYGHLFGDAVLCKVARELERLFRSQDILARIGGDEFLVLARGCSDMNWLQQRCSLILDAFHNAFQQPRLSGSVGVALYPDHGTTYQALFAHADEALYQAKALGKNSFCFYGSFEGQNLLHTGSTAISGQIDSDVELGLAQDNLVRYVFQQLYSAPDVEEAVNRSMSLLGRSMNVSRVYVFENTEDNLHCSNTFEWCNIGIEPEIQNLQMVSYETDIPGYEHNFDKDGIFHCPDVRKLPQQAREIVEAQGIKSMLQCIIQQNGVFRGYIGFDECVCQRHWTQEEVSMLNFFCHVLSTFLLRHREQEISLRRASELRTILDNQNCWLYIFDPSNWHLRYVNSQIRRRFPELSPNQPCYQALFGRDVPCPGCPATRIREEKAARSLMTDERYQIPLLSEASLIQWDGKDVCLMTCRTLPK